ncbi:CCA tRNA nucleotidyltransferase [Pseudanabaena sp. BC1403]|uniref:CCA tRNA nucleotidyltransferase n=1 Tax=Pseudanabaena sp. BC1403 TaxID=2043171 RepID=UPI000CD9C8AE|nr:CCA tRNA nucleotidyltransferase [Pseudanabaena sp. BC1403]
MYLKNFDRFFSPLQWQIILTTAQIAHDLNLRAFAVGGIVRDAIVRENHPSPPLHKDLDLVFDGGEQAGMKVAIALHQLFPASKLQLHEKFQTAALSWQDADQDFEMDMATARREIYAYAGANPQVIATTLEDDLWRRDFTINALAIELDPQLGIKGEVIDRFQGLVDLANKQVRAIREGSFEEDPRRLFRAVRFAMRLDLEIATETYTEIIATTSSGIHDAIGGARLRSELLYTLAEPRAGAMFELLQKLGALRCIHPDLKLPKNLTNSFKHQWRRSQYWLHLLNQLENKTYAPLQLGLELLLSYLPHQIATQLDLGLAPEQKTRQIKLADLLINLPNLVSIGLKNSEITQNLQKFDTQTLILSGAKCEPAQRRILWRYLTQWQMVKSPLTGADLKQVGYATGKQMGEILQRLRFATIDREILTKEDAIVYLHTQE